MISDRLFVYGTLMRGFDHPMAKLLAANADFLGDATCRGKLYLVRHYPGLVLSDEANDIVHGELFACARATRCCGSSTCTKPAAKDSHRRPNMSERCCR